MKAIEKKIEKAGKNLKQTRMRLNVWNLTDYPEDSLGFCLGCHLLKKNVTDILVDNEDIYHVLLAQEDSEKENLAVHYYLLGNGYYSIQTIMNVITGLLFYPQYIRYFLHRYCAGKGSVQFHNHNYFQMLNQPLDKIKDAFALR